ncbi:MAG: helix-turn-helix domain-containing protein [Bacteroidota bacterium]
MVCDRCISAVSGELQKVGLHPEKVALGEAVVKEESIDANLLAQLDKNLLSLGFERIDDRRARVIESTKSKIIQRIHHTDRLDLKENWSTLLADELHMDYNHLSSLFSSVEGITLEQYIIRQKIEKAKELLFYDELNLSQIADRLGYSSVAHLSGQFKKITGMTPSELKKSKSFDANRKPLDRVS